MGRARGWREEAENGDETWRGRRRRRLLSGAVRKIKNSRCASQCGDVDGERRFDGTVRPVVVVLAETKEEYYLRVNDDADRIRDDDRPSRCRRGVMHPAGHRRRRRQDETGRTPVEGWPQGGRACHRGS